MESVIVFEERHTTPAKPLRQEFQDLAAQWRKETWLTSSTSEIVTLLLLSHHRV